MMTAEDPLSGISDFVQVVEAGSFARAAERIGQTRSAVAKRIARLERRLGLKLLHRSAQHFKLSEAGQLYYRACRQLVQHLQTTENELQLGLDQPIGQLRMTAPVLLGNAWVAPILTELSLQHPDLSIDLRLENRVLDLVDEGFDLALRLGTLPDTDHLMSRQIGVQSFRLCAAPRYLRSRDAPQSVDQLSGYRRIVYGTELHVSTWQVRDPDGLVHELNMPSPLRFNDHQLIYQAACAGGGVARLPDWLIAGAIERGELEVLLGEHHVHQEPIHLVWPAQRRVPAKTRTAIDLLLARSASLGRVAEPAAEQT